jgi:F0F1-type ATP synthase membrane subunit b/b'
MGEISGKILGIVATVAVFIVVIMVAVYPAISNQGDTVEGQLEQQTTNLDGLESGNWSNPN